MFAESDKRDADREGADEVEIALWRAAAGFALGLFTGALLQRTRYCFMGAVSDWTVFGSLRRLRVWAMAAGLAVLGVRASATLAGLPLAESSYLRDGIFWLGALGGGLLFGIGMVLAGGCASRCLVRAGEGSVRALLAVLMLAISAFATMAGPLAPLHGWLRAVGTARPEAGAALPDLMAAPLGLGTGGTLLLSLLAGGALLAFALAEPRLRRPSRESATALGLAAAVLAGWWITGMFTYDLFEPGPVVSLSFVGPLARTVWFLMAGEGWPGFGVAVVLGVLAGSFAAARGSGEFRFDGFVDGGDAGRHLAGGLLMGVGGTLAMGCTVGQGLTGLSTLSAGSLLALLGIVLGGRLGVRLLAAGLFHPRALRGMSRMSPGTRP